MKQDEAYKTIINLASKHQYDYQQEKKRREKSFSAKKYDELIEKYIKFAEPFEEPTSYMYIDGNGYPTIGCGHIVGFNWGQSVFWDNKSTISVLKSLHQAFDNKNIQKSQFNNLDFPEQVKDFFPFELKDYLNLYEIKCVAFALFDALDMPLKSSQWKKSLRNKKTVIEQSGKIGDLATQQVITMTYSYLLSLSLMLKTRQDILRRPEFNSFAGRSFYHQQDNCLIIENAEMYELAQRDTAVKITELNAHLETFKEQARSKTPTYSFADLPTDAQIALIDLAFNGASTDDHVKDAAIHRDWKKLQNTKLYKRNAKKYEKRNEAVKSLFASAK